MGKLRTHQKGTRSNPNSRPIWTKVNIRESRADSMGSEGRGPGRAGYHGLPTVETRPRGPQTGRQELVTCSRDTTRLDGVLAARFSLAVCSALPRGAHVWSWGAAACVIPSVTSPWDNSPHRRHLSAEWCKPGQKPRSRPLRLASSAWRGAPLLLESRSGVTNGSWKLGLGGRRPGTGQVQCPGTLKTMRQPSPL